MDIECRRAILSQRFRSLKPLKVIWALFDIGMIGVLVSGVYLWMIKINQTFEKMINPLSGPQRVSSSDD